MLGMTDRERILTASARLATDSALLADCIDSHDYLEIIASLKETIDMLENMPIMQSPVEA